SVKLRREFPDENEEIAKRIKYIIVSLVVFIMQMWIIDVLLELNIFGKIIELSFFFCNQEGLI
ncbi:hypothetical protein LCGC14_2195120, partial [marine sediment metagenome]